LKLHINNMKKPEDWYSQWLDGDFGDMLSFVKDIQLEAYNQAIDDASENVELDYDIDEMDDHYSYYIDSNSILKLKKK